MTIFCIDPATTRLCPFERLFCEFQQNRQRVSLRIGTGTIFEMLGEFSELSNCTSVSLKLSKYRSQTDTTHNRF